MKKYHTYTVKARMLKLSQNVSNYHNSSSEVTRRVELAEGSFYSRRENAKLDQETWLCRTHLEDKGR